MPALMICPQGHRQQTTPRSFAKAVSGGTNGCPYCGRGAKAYPGESSILEKAPLIAKDWHQAKNPTLDPRLLSTASNVKVWWRCAVGHEEHCTVGRRVKVGGCSTCMRPERAVLLIEKYPSIASQLDPARNPAGALDGAHPTSRKRFFWRCDYSHSWQASCASRVSGNGCPVCSNKRLLTDFNDLQTRRPDLAVEWDPELNGAITPRDVVFSSSAKAYWRCTRAHSYRTRIVSRHEGSGCPVCAGQQALPGYNCLASKRPDVARHWHPYLNALTPQQVTVGSSRRAFWTCETGHIYLMMINQRTIPGRGCSACKAPTSREG
jgi:hypothetical protein